MRKLITLLTSVCVLGLVTGLAAMTPAGGKTPASDGERCAALQGMAVDSYTKITRATLVQPPFVTPASEMGVPIPPRPMSKPFCRAEVKVQHEKSEINYEVWLPVTANWNERFFGVGTGGFGGGILYAAPPTFAQGGLAGAVEKGYAAMATDYGHKSSGMNLMWAVNRPDMLADFGYRAVHVSTVGAKKITAAFYGKAPNYSYWDGCSRGGAMGMVNFQRWYEDYNGIIAGDPADWIRNLVSASAFALRQVRDPASRLPEAKRAMLHRAVLDQCDRVDGLADNLVGSASMCKFDPSKLLCTGKETDSCLTKPQLETVKQLYTGIRGRDGQQLADPYLPGSEQFWSHFGVSDFKPDGKPSSLTSVAQFWSGFVYEDPRFDPGKSLLIDEGQAYANKKLSWMLSNHNPDLSPFERAGGKVLLYHGEADGANSPVGTTSYYQDVVKTMGQSRADAFMRYYLVPGVGHCFGGDGPDVFNMLPALQNWVEKGQAPQPIIAAKMSKEGNVLRTRPLCPFPQVSKYKGQGDMNDAANFSCVAPARRGT